MKIKKIGHCCLLIRTGVLTVLTDPGAFTVEQDSITGIDVVLITHEHADHLHTQSVQAILKNNPQAVVISNSAVSKKLAEVGVQCLLVEGSNKTDIKGSSIEAFDCKHEEIFEQVGQVQNTGYFIDSRLFYPGDSFGKPGRKVDILALPVAGPWCKIPDAIRYALSVKPSKVFPVHDGMLQEDKIGGSHAIPGKVLAEHGIQFIPMLKGDEKEF
jgi:L-ascorbate metabolism protein UlaG (beta-lactamase superfamily)